MYDTHSASHGTCGASSDAHHVTLRVVENLWEFITRVLAERGADTITAFAARISTTRQTVARWNTSLPASETLRRVAEDLDVPYSQVLSAGLVSAGYVTTPADLLAGQAVHVVVVDDADCPSCSGGAVAGVFSDAADAAEFTRVSQAIEMADFEPSVIRIDSAAIPDAIEIHTTTWWSRTDRIQHSSDLVGERPARLIGRDISDIEVAALGDDDQIFELTVSSIDEAAGRRTLLAQLDQLRNDGKLMPPNLNPLAGQPYFTLAELADQLRPRYIPPTEPKAGEPTAPHSTREPSSGDTTGIDDSPNLPTVGELENLAASAGQSAPPASSTTPPTGVSSPGSAQASAELFRTAHRAAAALADKPYVWGGGIPPEPPAPSIKRYTIAATAPGDQPTDRSGPGTQD